MLPNKLIEAITHLKECGCDGIKCIDCPLNNTSKNEELTLCDVLFELSPSH